MTHPRDHVLCLGAQLRSDYTDVTKVTVKVRVNGGAATTYTNVSAPAVTQAQDCTFGYHLELPAGSFADGDRVSRTWIYNGVPVAYGDTIIGPASVDGAHYTAARGDKLDELDPIKAKTDLLGAGAVSVTSPVSATGNVAIVAGDDYKAADSRALQWVGTWPSLAGATIELTVTGHTPSYSGSSAVVGTAQVVTVDLTAAQTATFAAGRYAYTLTATLASGREITLARGPLTVS